MNRLKNPPYYNQLIHGPTDTIFIYIGGSKAWDRAKNQHSNSVNRSLVLPENSNPAAYRWPVKGRDIIVIDYASEPDEPKYKKLSLVLLRSGCTGVIVIHKTTYNTYRYRRGQQC